MLLNTFFTIVLLDFSICSATQHCISIVDPFMSRKHFLSVQASRENEEAPLISWGSGNGLKATSCYTIYTHSPKRVVHFESVLPYLNKEESTFKVLLSDNSSIVDTSVVAKIPVQYIMDDGSYGPLVCPDKSTFEAEHDSCSFSLKARKSITVGVFGLIPHIIMPKANGGKLGGGEFDIVEIIVKHLGIEVEYLKDVCWAKLGPDGKNNHGCVTKKVYDGLADFGIGSFIINVLTYRSLDFTRTTGTSDLVLCCSKPRVLPPFLNIIRPFTLEVWVMEFITILVTSLVAQSLFHKATRSSSKHYRNNREWLVFFGINMGQSRRMESSVKSLQVLGVFALVYNFLMDASFSCNLRANLVKKQYEEMPETLDDMPRLGRTYFYPGNSLFKFRLSNHRTSSCGRSFPPSALTIPDNVIDSLLHEGSCLFSFRSATLLRLAARRMKPHLHGGALDSLFRLGSKNIFADNVAFILAKGSPIKRELDQLLAQLYEAGIIAHLIKRNALGWNSPIGVKDSDIPEVFTLEHLAVQFMAAGLGLAAAAAAFMPEFAAKRERGNRQRIKVALKRASEAEVMILGDYAVQW